MLSDIKWVHYKEGAFHSVHFYSILSNNIAIKKDAFLNANTFF